MVPLKLNKGRKSILGGKKMRKSVLVAILFLFFVSFIPLNAQWARTYGGSLDDEARCVQQTSDGGYVVVGKTRSFGYGLRGIWVLKLDNDGTIEWQYYYGQSYSIDAKFIQQTSDGGYIVLGSSTYHTWVLKLGSTGAIEWDLMYLAVRAHSIQQTSDGGYVVVGYGGYSKSWLILKLSSFGLIEWDYCHYGWEYHDSEIYSVQQTSDNGYILAGYLYNFWRKADELWVLKLNSDGSIDWGTKCESWQAHTYAKSVQQTSDGGYIVGGYIIAKLSGSTDALILKLSSLGDKEWYKSYRGSVLSVQQTSDGDYLSCAPALISKFSSSGSREWSKKYNDFIAQSIQQTNDDGFIVTGHTSSFGAGLDDFMILKLDSEGDIDPSCELIEDYSPELGSTITVEGQTIPAYRAYRTYGSSSFFSQETNAIVNLICELQKYTLTISATTGGTTDPVSGTYIHDSGTDVSVQATANSGYNFTGWSGDASGTTNPITITMDSDKSVTANFEAIPEPPEPADGGDGKKGGCFIATAAYGSPLHPHIDILRDFRDQYLMTNKVGQALVNFYYKYSPGIANFISKYKILKTAVRIHLRPLISLSYLIVH